MEKDSISKIEMAIENGFLIINKQGRIFRFELKKISERLANATEEELKQFRLSPSGYGIHWYAIDEDISIPALLNEPINPYAENE